MRRRTESPSDDERPTLPPHGTPPELEPESPCPGCRRPTKRTELAQYGARCSSCYAAWCQAAPGQQASIPDKRTGGPLAWAKAIVDQHNAGKSVTPARLTMARDALNARPTSGGD